MIQHNPDTVAPPVGAFSHAIEVPPGARTLFLSGQLGIDPEGNLGKDIQAQSRLVWENISSLLKAANMDFGNLVKVTAYLTDLDDLAEYGAARSAALGDHRPASTLLFVSHLASPDWKVEVEVIAAEMT